MRRRIDCFRDGHPGYPDWLAVYPKGFVLTLRGPETVPILHRADCPHVSSRQQRHPRSGQCEKRCAPQRTTIEQWSAQRRDIRPILLCVTLQMTFERSAFMGPGYASVDAGLHRTFSLGQQRRVSVGLEAFNLLNRANYLRPSTEYFAMTNVPGGIKRLEGPIPSFGRPLDATRSRQLQLVLRFYF